MNSIITINFPTGHLVTGKSPIRFRVQITRAVENNSMSVIIDLYQTA